MIAAVLALSLAQAASALDFSADMVSTMRGGPSVTGRTFVSGDKVRMEAAGAVTITRVDKGVTWVIVPDQDLFMEQPIDMSKVAGATDKVPGEIERTPLGRESVDGRAADKFRVAYEEKGRRVTVFQWIDPASGIPVKTSAADGSWSVEYRNLSLARQPDSLFEVPARYSKMKIPTMADMMAMAGQGAPARGADREEE
jgi:hypothetical protein